MSDNQHSTNGEASPRGELEVALQTELPASLAVGRGNALFAEGRASVSGRKIRELAVTVDGRGYPVLAHGMPVPGSIAGGDYWWAIVPFEERTRRTTARLGLQAKLLGGGSARAELGSIELVPHLDFAPAPDPGAASNGGSDARGREGPLVAICMATFEPPIELFKRQIESIMAQTHENWVCVISDDLSDGERLTAMRQVLGDDPRFLVFPSRENRGFYRNFERAVALAPREAEYLAFSDQDDAWYPEKLEVLLSQFDDPGVTLAYSDMRIVSEDGEVVSDTYWKTRRNNYTNLRRLLIANTITGAASLFRRELLKFALPFPPPYASPYHDHWVADVALTLGDVRYVNRPLYDYVQHGKAALGHTRANRGRKKQKRRPGAAPRRRRMLHPAWRNMYFRVHAQQQQFARILQMRCAGHVAPRKWRALERVTAVEESLTATAGLAVRAMRPRLKRTETLGRERTILRAVAWRRMAARRGRVVRRPPRQQRRRAQRQGGPRQGRAQAAHRQGQAPRRQPARGRGRPARARRQAAAAGGPGGTWLTPILVDYFARDGSTLAMRLLASSPQISVERQYPYERKYFAYLWRWARMLDREDWPREIWRGRELGSLAQEKETPFLGPPPWKPRRLYFPGGNEPSMSEKCFEMAWHEFSRRAARRTRAEHGGSSARVHYYAEKHLNTWHIDLDELPPTKVVVLLRDPRDTYVSIRAFDSSRRGDGFGQDRAGSEEEHLRDIIERQRERLQWILAGLDEERFIVVRYEDLVRDLPAVARRLGDWLGVELKPGGVVQDEDLRQRHVTSRTPEDSIGRWKQELGPETAGVFHEELGVELEGLSFESTVPG